MKKLQPIIAIAIHAMCALGLGYAILDSNNTENLQQYITELSVFIIAYTVYAFAFSVILQVTIKRFQHASNTISAVIGIFVTTTGPLGWEWLHYKENVFYIALLWFAITLLPMLYVLKTLNSYTRKNLNRILNIPENADFSDSTKNALLFITVGFAAYITPLLFGDNSIIAISN